MDIDKLWLHVMLAAIGETLEDEEDDEVMGVVVNIRKGFYRVGLWTRSTGQIKGRGADKDKEEVLKKIGRGFKDTLGLKSEDKMEFTGHTDAANSGSTRAKAKYTC